MDIVSIERATDWCYYAPSPAEVLVPERSTTQPLANPKRQASIVVVVIVATDEFLAKEDE